MRFPRSTATVAATIFVALTAAMLLPYKSRDESARSGSDQGVEPEGGAARPRTVVLTPEVQARIGLRTEPLVVGEVPIENKAFGRAVDPTPLAEAEAAVVAARANSEVLERSLARSRGLFERDASVSQRAVEAISADAARARVELDVAHAHLVGVWGSAVAGRSDLDALIHKLVAGDARLVKLDLAADEQLASDPRNARIEPTLGAAAPLEAACLGEAGAVDAVNQGRSYFFIVESPPPALLPGTAVIGYVRTAELPEKGVLLPRTAVVRAEGSPWVYVQIDTNAFERRFVELDRATASGWVVRRRLAAGDRVVVVGAQELFSAEFAEPLGAAGD